MEIRHGRSVRARTTRRRVLLVTHNEQVGNRLRFALSGRNSEVLATVVPDLQTALHSIKRIRPRVVIFVEEGQGGPVKVDNRLMLLQILLLNEKLSRQNTLGILYSLADGQLTMYHNVHFASASLEDLAHVVKEGAHCPLFGYAEEAAPGFPKDCRFLPLMIKGAALAPGVKR